jgi:methylglutaconyl-CoA hydratase
LEACVQFETIVFDLSSRGVATIRLNRPAHANAFDRAMLAELAGALAHVAAHDDVRLAVLRGEGRHFCAGADLTDRDRAESGTLAGPTLFAVLDVIDHLPKPTIAAVHGGAIGGGAAIAACCDIVVVTEAAFFSIPEVRIGMAPARLAPFLIRAMGQRAFRRYGISGERIGAAEALRIGFAHELCPLQSLDRTIADIADALLHGAPGAIRELKAACARLAMPVPPTAPDAEPASRGLTKTPEALEGILSFREKRKPRWYPQ